MPRPTSCGEVAASAALPVRLIHRERRTGGLGGAVLEGLAAAESDACLVMDGDLQHPPEEIPRLYERFAQGDVDVVVASRYARRRHVRGPRRPHPRAGVEGLDRAHARDVPDPAQATSPTR